MSGDGTLDVVRALGITVLEVPDLPRPLLYVREHELALVRAGLDPEEVDAAAHWLLSAWTSGGAR